MLNSYCEDIYLFVSAQEMSVIDLDGTDHVFYNLGSLFSFYVSTLVAVRSGLDPALSCSVSITSGILHQNVFQTEDFFFYEILQNSFGFFVGKHAIFEEYLTWNPRFCDNYITLSATIHCNHKEYSAKDEIRKTVYVQCSGNPLSWENIQVICLNMLNPQ